MAEYEDGSELDDSVSTISVDSVTRSNLAVSQNLPGRASTPQPCGTKSSEHATRQKKRVDNIPHDQVNYDDILS